MPFLQLPPTRCSHSKCSIWGLGVKQKLYAELCNCSETKRLPTNVEMGRRCGNKSRSWISHTYDQLENAGLIRSDRAPNGMRIAISIPAIGVTLHAFNRFARAPNSDRSKPLPDGFEKAKDRRCLMCWTMFYSHHVGERICGRCRETEMWKSG